MLVMQQSDPRVSKDSRKTTDYFSWCRSSYQFCALLVSFSCAEVTCVDPFISLNFNSMLLLFSMEFHHFLRRQTRFERFISNQTAKIIRPTGVI